jgi:large subunit ribosomal protein L25
MEEIRLNAEQRQITGKRVKHLRTQGYIPAVLYGHHTEPISLQVEQRALNSVLQEAGANRLVTLQVEGIDESRRVLVRELQRDSISHAALHVDFYEVIMTEKLTAEVPLVLVGTSPIVQRGEALLFEGLDSVEIECLPGDLPPQIEVDISGLVAIDDTIVVGDLRVSDAVEILLDPDEIVVRILPPEREEIEEEVVPEVAEVEIIGKERVTEEGPLPEGSEQAQTEKER